MKNNKNTFFLRDKLSLDRLKTTDPAHQCRFKDFQPFLDYSSWHVFEEVVRGLIKGCKKSVHLVRSIVKDHGMSREWEDSLLTVFYKALGKGKKIKKGRVKALKKEEDPLYDLFSHRRHYSIFPKE